MQVKLTVVNSIISTIYWRYKWNQSICYVPSGTSITAIERVASTYPIQMLKILAKSLLCLLWPYLDQKPHKAIQLNDIEIQSCLNFLQGRPSLYHAAIVPICNYMEDLIRVSDENRYSFLIWNTCELLFTMKRKCKDLAVADSFEKLSHLLLNRTETPLSVNEVSKGMCVAM